MRLARSPQPRTLVPGGGAYVQLEVDEGHREALEALADSYSRAIALEMRCDPTGSPMVGDAFRAHFESLSASVDRWNTLVARAQGAPEALWRRFTLSARDHGITEPPFVVGVLIDDLATWTLELCRRWELGVAHRAPIEHFRDRIGGSECVSVYIRGRRVAVLPSGPDTDVARRVAAADTLIQALFEEARTSPEARLIAETRDAVLDLQAQLLDDIDIQTANGIIAVVPECPECARRLAGGVVANAAELPAHS